MEKVADVLGRKFPQFNTVSPNCLVSNALYQMRCENVDHLIVLDGDNFLGILTDHDIAGKVLFAERPLNKIFVREFVNRTLPVATSNDSLEYCLQLMERFNVKHLIIYDDFSFRGVVSSQDLMQQAFTMPVSFEEKYARGYSWNY